MRRLTFALCIALVLLALFPALLSAAEPAASAGDPILERAIQTANAAQPPYLRARVLILVAETCVETGQLEQARRALRLAHQAALSGTNVEPLMPVQVAQACLRLGFPAEALEIAAELEASADRLDLTLAAIDALKAKGRAQEASAALNALTQAFAADSDALLAVRALAEAATRAEPSAAQELLQRAGKTARAAAPGVMPDALAEVAGAYARLGMDDAAHELALRIEKPGARLRALLRTALELARSDEAAAAERAQEAASDARALSRKSLHAALSEAARKAVEAGHRNLGILLLGEARDAAARAEAKTRESLLRETAGLYGSLLDDWQTALAVARRSDDPWMIRTSRAHVLLQMASEGQLQPARKLWQEVAGDSVDFIGSTLQAQLGAAYFQFEPDADLARVMELEPEVLRDNVLAARARQALDKGDLPTAFEWARPIEFSGLSEEILYEVALRTLKQADAARIDGALQTVGAISPMLRSELRRQYLSFLTALKQIELGNSAAVADIIAQFRQNEPIESGDARTLCRIAILEHALRRNDAATTDMAEALTVIRGVTCGSCRDSQLTDMLKDLLETGDAVLLKQAVDSGALSLLPPRPAMEVVETLPDLSDEARAIGLGLALQAAAAERLHARGAETLAVVAAAYHRLGIEPSAQVLAALPPVPEPTPIEVWTNDRPPPAALASAPARLVFFTRTGCAQCRDARELLDAVMADMDNVIVEEAELSDETATLLNEAFCDALNIPERDRQVAPAVFALKQALVGSQITEESLRALITNARGLPSPKSIYGFRLDSAQNRLSNRFQALNLLVVVGAGLLDGLNPCAFAVIIFFLSYLALLGKERGQIAAAGIVFTAAVFLTYLAIGIFLQEAVRFGQARSALFSRALYGVTAAFVLVAAVLSLRDGILCLRGRAQDMTLALPDKLKGKIRRTVSRRTRMGLTIGAMAVLGAVVALIEFPCTGQVYGPTIVYGLNHLPQQRLAALGWLVLYNLFFILPLVLVFVAVLFGLTSERLTALFRRHLAATKFALAGLFVVLFALMVRGVL